MSQENTNLSDSSTKSQNNSQTNTEFKPWGMELNTFCMLMHLSQFFGIVLTIVMWMTNKDQSEVINQHGKIIMNAVLSYFIWIIVSCALATPLLLVFTIIAAVEANKGNLYNYPLSIKFFK